MQAGTVLENEKCFFGRVEGMAYVLLDSTSERGLGDAKELDLFQRASLLNGRSQSEGLDLGVEQNRIHVVVLQVLCFDKTNFEVRRRVNARVVGNVQHVDSKDCKDTGAAGGASNFGIGPYRFGTVAWHSRL